MTLQDLLEDYVETRLAYDKAHAISSNADARFKAAKRRLADGMIANTKSYDPPDIPLKFHLRDQFTFACNVDNEDDVKEWLHERYGDIEEFTVPKVVKSTVTDRFQADIEAELLDEFDVPDFFDLKTRPDVSCNGWKAYSEEQRSE